MHRVVLAFLSGLFAIQDFVRRLFRVEYMESTKPPLLPGTHAAIDGRWEYLPSRHGDRLFYRYWLPADGQPHKANLIAIHGVGAHGWHFWVLGKYLATQGYGTYALDLRGHGHSEGPRGDLSKIDPVVDGIIDLAHFLTREYPERPVVVLGESFGSNMVMLAAARNDPSISAVILAGTPLEPTEEASGGQLLDTLKEYGQYIPYIFINSQARVVDIAGREERVSRDPEAVRRSKGDPLRNNKLSIRTFAETYRVIKEVYDTARRVRVPALLLQGGHDLVTRPEAVYKLRDALGTDDVEVAIFPDAYHGLFFDPDTPKVMETIVDWMNRKVSTLRKQ